MPFAILGLALWLAMERGSNARRAAIFVPLALALALYQMHLVAFATLGAAAFGRECHRLLTAPQSERRRSASQMAISAVPFVIPVLVFIATALLAPESETSSRTEYGSFVDRWLGILSPVHFRSGPDLISLSILVFVIAAGLSVLRQSGMRLSVKSVMFGPLIALLVMSLATPNRLSGVALMQLRFPLVLVILGIAATASRISRPQSIVLTLALLTLLTTRSLTMERIFAAFESEVADLRATLDQVPVGGAAGSAVVGEVEL